MPRYGKSQTVTPSDTVDIFQGVASDGLFIGGAGNAVLVLEDNSTLTLTAATALSVWPFAVKRVMSTGTTATGIKALRF